MRRALSGFAFAFAAALAVAACAPNIQPDSYSSDSVGQTDRTAEGVILNVRAVEVSGTDSGIGLGVGAVAGGLAGSYIGGKNRGELLGALGGAVVGGAVGAMAEEAMTKQTGWEYIVRMDDGAVRTLVQGGDPLAVDRRVWVIYGGDRTRIIAQ